MKSIAASFLLAATAFTGTTLGMMAIAAPALSVPVLAAGQEPEAPELDLDMRYRIQPTDVLVVKYRYTPEYDYTAAVTPDGFLTLPILGSIHIEGLTLDQAHEAIHRKAAERFREPEVTVELKEFQKPRFIVGGEVGTPGQFELRGQVHVLEAIAIAGGFKASAKHSQVVLFRRRSDDLVVRRVLDAKAMAKDGNIEDIELRAGDFLFVPQNRVSKVTSLVPLATFGLLLNAVLGN
jgi:polysaccharide export outer membrane protein